MAARNSPCSWRPSRSSAAFAALAAAALTSAASAQAPAGQQAPRFGSRVDLVEIDATVLDKTGRPVTTLTAGDFEIRERGELQRISTIALVTGDPALLKRAPVPAPAGADQPDALPPVVIQSLPPRVFVFVLDLTHMSAAGFTRSQTAIRSFLEDGLRSGDFAGIVVDGKMLGNRLVTEKSALLAQINSLGLPNFSRFTQMRQWPRLFSEEEAVAIARGTKGALEAALMRACEERPGDCVGFGREIVERDVESKGRQVAAEAIRDSETTLGVLTALVSGLGRFPGPKHVAFLSEGFFTGELMDRVAQVSGLAARNRVRISTLDARGLNTDLRQQDLLGEAPVTGTGDLAGLNADSNADVLTTLALDTGGQRVRNRNNLRPALDAIAIETGTYYLIGYTSTKPFDGSYRQVSVKVKQPDLTVRARRGYLAASIDSPAPDAPRPAADTRVPEPAAAPLPGATGLPPVTVPAVASPAPAPPPAAAPAPAAAPVAGDPNAIRLRPDSAKKGAATVTTRLADPAPVATEKATRLAREGWDLYSKGNVEGARDLLAASVDAGGSLWMRYALGLCEMALGHLEPARDAFEAVRKGEPAFEGVYFDLADVYLQLKRQSNALSILRDAAERWPQDAETHNAVGVVLLLRGALEDAVESFTRATTVAPTDGIGFFNLGYAQHLRYQRWLRTSPGTGATGTLAERTRLAAIEAYRKSITLGGSFEQRARDAITILGG